MREQSLFSPEPLFALGLVVATPGALDALARTGIAPDDLLARHVHGDWGQLSEGDRDMNNQALSADERLLSAYDLSDNSHVWIITEADRSSTTLLLPEEY